MAEIEEDLKNLLMRVKEENGKSQFETQQKTKIMACGPVTSWQIEGETVSSDRV